MTDHPAVGGSVRSRALLALPAEVSALCARRVAAVDVLSLLKALRPAGLPWLLESSLAGPGGGRFSFVGADPYAVVRARGRSLCLEQRRKVRPAFAASPTSAGLGDRSSWQGDPIEIVRALLPPAPERDLGPEIPFCGGALGVFGYELAESIDPVGLCAVDDLGLPDLTLLLVDRVIAIDHELEVGWMIGLGIGTDRASAAERATRQCDALAAQAGAALVGELAASGVCDRRALTSRGCGDAGEQVKSASPGFDRSRYAASVGTILDRIEAGDVYQANLTQRISLPFDGNPLALYQELRSQNPAPYAAYLELPEMAVASSSPECFLRVGRDGVVFSDPMKGTRRRGAGVSEDRALAQALLASGKDRAENLMIVDLVRNDLGRVCECGSIAVPSLMRIESFATVHQLVSTVAGKLRPDCDALAALRAAFPPGSMTGAPKIAAMRLIDRLEPVRRGFYSGALGYLDVRGGAELSVVIRTLFVADGVVHLHAGGGIVADSDPAAEYREVLDKAAALLMAVRRASGHADPGAAPVAALS